MIVEVKLRYTVYNYKMESSISYDVGYINLSRVEYVLVMGDVARVVFGPSDYVEMDLTEWKRANSET